MTNPVLRRRDTGIDPIDEAEWRTRVDLAALYRLVTLHGWDDAIFTHISARVPGAENQFLINRLGLMFDEITASNLVKVDIDGNILDHDPEAQINRAGYVIHSAIHAVRHDANFIIHLHTLDGMAVSCQRHGLLPLSQTSLTAWSRLAYHDYEGIALDIDERERLVADMGDNDRMILRNHGTLAVGASPGEAWLGIYYLERACSLQVRALSAGMDGVACAPEAAQAKVAALVTARRGTDIFALPWSAMLRRVERESPGYDG